MEKATTWVLDPIHSEVQFKVRHLVISTVSGFFKKFEANLTTENEDFDGASVAISLDAGSIDTNFADYQRNIEGGGRNEQ